jgi:pimeloyl-ACP methyl ester carboxylesterase
VCRATGNVAIPAGSVEMRGPGRASVRRMEVIERAGRSAHGGATERPDAVTTRVTDMGDYRVHSVHAGAGAPVVLLHGLAGSHRWWRLALPVLATRFAVHVPELVGFGASRPAPRQPTIPRMARLLVRWLARLETGPVHVVGHSMGAEIALHMAAGEPHAVRRLVLASAAGVPHEWSPAELLRVAARFGAPRAWGRRRFLATVAMDTLRAGPWTLLDATRHILADDVRPLLPRVHHPTLLIWGEHDPLTPVRDGQLMQGALPDARLVVVKGAAHNVMIDRPSVFNRLVTDFLDDDDPHS